MYSFELIGFYELETICFIPAYWENIYADVIIHGKHKSFIRFGELFVQRLNKLLPYFMLLNREKDFDTW